MDVEKTLSPKKRQQRKAGNMKVSSKEGEWKWGGPGARK